jgi:ankyrin repeat protein
MGNFEHDAACDAIRRGMPVYIFSAILAHCVRIIDSYDLVALALASDPKYLNALLDAGLSIHTEHRNLLAEAHRLETVQCLLARGANPNACHHGTPPLISWCSSARSYPLEFLDIISAILNAGAAVNAQDSAGSTALHAAFRSGFQSHDEKRFDALIRILFAAGARIDIANAEGVTALHVALAHCRPTETLFRALVQAGAPTTVDIRFRSNNFTFCHLAASFGDRDLMAMLINERDADINAVATDGYTPLMLAVENGRFDIVTLLIAAGANVNVSRERDNASALHLAFRADVADALINAGADVNVAESTGWTPGHYAVAVSDIDLIVRILGAGADVNRANANGDTLLHVAALTSASDVVVRALVDAGGDLDAKNDQGQTACHIAVKNEIVLRALIELGASCDLFDRWRQTPLRLAIDGNFERSIELLLLAGASAALIDTHGSSMLHALMTKARVNPKIVRMLVARGIDIHVRNARGDSASDIAIQCCSDGLRALLALGAQLPEAVVGASHIETYALLIASGCVVDSCVDLFGERWLANAESSAEDGEAFQITEELVKARLDLVRARGAEVCIGLHSLRVNALQLCEILLHACAPAAAFVPFHELWSIAVKAKHFKKH